MKTPVAAIAIALAALPLIVVSADTTASTSAEVEVLKGRIETLERELATLRNQVFREVPWTNQGEVVVDTVNGLTYTGAVRTINVCNFQMLMDCDPVRQEDRDTIRSNRLSRIRGRQSNLGGLRRPGPSVSTSMSTNSAGRAATPLLGGGLMRRTRRPAPGGESSAPESR